MSSALHTSSFSNPSSANAIQTSHLHHCYMEVPSSVCLGVTSDSMLFIPAEADSTPSTLVVLLLSDVLKSMQTTVSHIDSITGMLI